MPPLRALDLCLVFVGSGLGGVARHLLSGWLLAPKTANAFPTGTFLVNISGCLLLGLLMGVLSERRPEAWSGWRLLLGVGFLGGFTTFSTLLYDTWRLGPRTGLLNLFLSGAAGWVATVLGALLARRL